jgi:hypothetical protein
VAFFPLDAAAAAHRIGLLGDGDKLEENTLRLKRARHLAGRQSGSRLGVAHNRFNLGHVPADDSKELIPEKVRGFRHGSRRESGRQGYGRRYAICLRSHENSPRVRHNCATVACRLTDGAFS